MHLLCMSPQSALKAPLKEPKSSPKASSKHPQKHPTSIPKALQNQPKRNWGASSKHPQSIPQASHQPKRNQTFNQHQQKKKKHRHTNGATVSQCRGQRNQHRTTQDNQNEAIQVSPSREDRKHKIKVINPPLQHTNAKHRNKKIEKSNQREERHKHHKTSKMTTTMQSS